MVSGNTRCHFIAVRTRFVKQGLSCRLGSLLCADVPYPVFTKTVARRIISYYGIMRGKKTVCIHFEPAISGKVVRRHHASIGVRFTAMHPDPMPKDICCENFKGLLAYIRHHYGAEGIRQLTAGLLDGDYFVRDKLAPDRIIPIGLDHLTDPAYWVSNAFSLILLGNVNRVVPGPNPLYTAGYGMVRESLSRTTLFAAKFAGIRRLAMRAAKINARFNRTKDVHPVDITDTSLSFELTYRPGYDVTKDVCNWNLGIYSGIGSLTGVADISARETACVLDGAPHCRFHLTWRKRRLLPNGIRGLVAPLIRWAVQDLIAEHEKNIEEREALIDKLAASENKYRTLFEDSFQAMSLSPSGQAGGRQPGLAQTP